MKHHVVETDLRYDMQKAHGQVWQQTDTSCMPSRGLFGGPEDLRRNTKPSRILRPGRDSTRYAELVNAQHEDV